MTDPLLSVEGLKTQIPTERGTVRAVDGVSFDVGRGETVALVGESGSGKTVTCETITRLVPESATVSGTVRFDGETLTDLEERALRRIRGNRIAHVFQNPGSALDPVYTVGDQITEAITLHHEVGESARRERAVSLLRRVGIPDAGTRIDDYPHEFSGGQRQRIALAIAVASEPDLLLADEPTTSVDVTVQARLLALLSELTGSGTSMLLVTHDLRVVAALADRVVVMFEGQTVERGPTEALFGRPAHPYTQALVESAAGLGDGSDGGDTPRDGCRFRHECPHAIDACAVERPPFEPVGSPDHAAACVHYAPERDPSVVLADAESAWRVGRER
jgi:peptide/nickel transport system ATP-binding protein